MALKQVTKWIVFMDDFTELAVKNDRDPTIDDFDYAIPVFYTEKDGSGGKRAERLPPIALNQNKGRGVVIPI